MSLPSMVSLAVLSVMRFPNSNCVPIRISQTLQADFFLFSVCVALLNKLCQGEQVIRAQPMRQILVDEPEQHFLSELILTAR